MSKAARAERLEQANLDDILRFGAQELFADDEGGGGQASAAAGTAAGGGGGGARRIVWDGPALDRLLDRSALSADAAAAAAAAEGEEGEDDEADLNTAFRVSGDRGSCC
jgi:hypothetical protein